MRKFIVLSLTIGMAAAFSTYAKETPPKEAKAVKAVTETGGQKVAAATAAPQKASTGTSNQAMGWEVTTNVLGYSLTPIAVGAYDMQAYDFNMVGLYSLAPEHIIGIEPTYFTLAPTSKAQLATLINGVSDFNIKGFGFSPVYRWYEAGFGNSTAVFGLRVPVKFLTLNTTQAGTGVVGNTNFTIIQVLAELGYRFKWDNITLTPGAFVGYRTVSLNSSFSVDNVAYTLGSNANIFLNGMGYGAQLSLGVAF